VRIVGVMPPGFDFPEGTDLWYPLELYLPNEHRSAHNWKVVGRLGDGVDLDAAERDLSALTRRIVAEEAGAEGASLDYLAAGATLTPLLEDVRRAGTPAAAPPLRGRRAWRGLVAAEVALSLVLLAGSGLLLRSLWRTLQEDPGFDAERVAAVTVHPPTSLYPGGDQRRSYFAGLVDALAASPGVVAAGVTSDLLLAATAFGATWLPARATTTIDPVETLKSE
jgi:hypothetical protein